MAKTLITSGQEKQYKRFFDDARDKALKEANLGKDGMQKLIEKGDEFQLRIMIAIKELSVSNQFADEEVESSYGYLSGYDKPCSIENQISILRSHWPNLNPDKAICYMREVYSTLQLPDWIEGSFVWIRPGFFSDKHYEELEEILKAIRKDRKGKFCNYREGQFNIDNFRQYEHATLALCRIVEQQPESDLLIVPAQFGMHGQSTPHITCSVRRVREKFVVSEFGINSKDTGTMILTNENRLQHYDDLWINCAGDEYAPDAGDDFSRAPCFSFGGGKVRFGAGRIDDPDAYYGSVSGFVPQS